MVALHERCGLIQCPAFVSAAPLVLQAAAAGTQLVPLRSLHDAILRNLTGARTKNSHLPIENFRRTPVLRGSRLPSHGGCRDLCDPGPRMGSQDTVRGQKGRVV